MDPGNDPALSLFSRDEDGSDASSLIADPKFTVRLPYPVYVDAVTLEHRSFPLCKSESEGGSVLGGESAPRWVRVVGFPPCPTNEDDEEGDEGVEDGCRARGFDIERPIDLTGLKTLQGGTLAAPIDVWRVAGIWSSRSRPEEPSWSGEPIGACWVLTERMLVMIDDDIA